MRRGGATSEPTRARRALHLGLFAIPVFAVGLWLAFLWLRRDDPETWNKDWFCFYSAGSAFLESGTVGIYERQCIEHYFWLYPPYMLYAYALASFLPPLTFYSILVVEIFVLTAVSLKLMGGALPYNQRFTTIALFIVASAAFFATVVVGQHSALLLAGLAGALWALQQDRRFVAGLCLGILGIKPNWAVVFVVWLVVTRRWRELGGMVTVGVVMILSTLPMGVEVWLEYVVAAPRHVEILVSGNLDGLSYPAHKLVTFEAFTRSTFGTLNQAAGDVAWIALEILAIVACLVVWLRSEDVRDQLAMTVLVVVAANVYVEFYDLLVLGVPAAIWWTGRDRYPAGIWTMIGIAAAGMWVCHWVWVLTTPGPDWPSLVGGFLAIWIGAEALRAWRGVESAGGEAEPASKLTSRG